MEQNNIHPREVASEILSEYLLNDFDGLIEAGTNLDNLVRRELQKVGNRVLENLYQTISERLSLMYKEQGYHIEQHKKVPFKTLYGDVEVASPYLRKAGEQEGVRPMKEVMGVIGKGYSGGLDRALIDFGSEKSFRRGMAQLKEHYNVEISVSSMIRHTESSPLLPIAVVPASMTNTTTRFLTIRRRTISPTVNSLSLLMPLTG